MNDRARSPSLLAALTVVLAFAAGSASAGIIKIKDEQSCSVIGLDEPDAVRGGVHCDVGDNPFSLSSLLSGDIGLYVGDSQTPSWNLVNDTGGILSSLTLYYSGLLADNADIDMQVGDGIFDECMSVDANGVTAGALGTGKCDAKSAKPEDGLLLPLAMTWAGGTGLGIGQIFNLGTASFAHSGQDAGCFSGTPDCQPTNVPAPPGLALMMLVAAGFMLRRRR